MPSIAETTTEMVQLVFPEHAGAPGQIHGGRMMQWITQAATMAAGRVARGMVVLGSMDDIDFLAPVRVGELAILRAQVEYVGRSSLEVGVRVWAENVATGRRVVTLNSHLVLVSVDDGVRPRPVPQKIAPIGSAEQAIFEAARVRREQRLARFAQRTDRGAEAGGEDGADAPLELVRRTKGADAPLGLPRDEDVRWRFESVRSILPEDALFGTTMFSGKMLMDIDEAGGILSMRYCKGFVMTACLDAMDFYSPIWTHEVVTFKAGLNHVGRSSLEVGVKVMAEKPWTGEIRHACTAFLTFVHLEPTGDGFRPAACRPFTPETPAEQRRWQEAVVRREARIERVKRLRAALANEERAD